MGSVWLATNTGYDHGSVEAIVETREEAREWIEKAHRRAVWDGERMEAFVEGDAPSIRRDVGWWLPTDIEPIEDGEGWCFDDTQGGPGHDHTRIARFDLPYYARDLATPTPTGEEADDA